MTITLITGASSGIGRALALRCRRRGDRIIAVARRADLLAELGRELGEGAAPWRVTPSAGESSDFPTGCYLPIVCDTRDGTVVRAVCDALKERSSSPDLLFLCAGRGEPEDEDGLRTDLHERTFATNYFGALHWIEAFYERDRPRTFVGISSIAGFRGLPGAAAYGASKAALTHTLEALACASAATGHRFVPVHPGPVDTPMLKTDGPVPFTLSAEEAAERILRGLDQDRPRIDFAPPWTWIARLVRALPARVHRHLFGTLRARHRERRGALRAHQVSREGNGVSSGHDV